MMSTVGFSGMQWCHLKIFKNFLFAHIQDGHYLKSIKHEIMYNLTEMSYEDNFVVYFI